MKLAARIGISVGVAVATMLLAATPFVHNLDLDIFDQFLRLRGKSTPPPGVVVVALDETSYRELKVPFGPPWPRALHAKLLNRLKELGAKKVVFDILFMGPGMDPKADKALAEAFAQIPSVIGVESSVRQMTGQNGTYYIEEIERPYEAFRKVTTEALVGLRADDGVIRTFPVHRSEGESQYPFLAQAGAEIDHTDASLMPRSNDLIRYYGPARTIPMFSYWEVLQEDLPIAKAKLKDAVVFVGIALRSDTGGAQKDSYPSPFGGSMIYGVEVHATIVANLLSKGWISRPARALEVLSQGLVVGGFAFVSFILSPLVLFLVAAGCVLLWAAWVYVGLGLGIFTAGAAVVLFGLPSIVLVNAIYAYLVSHKAEESLRSAFSLYVSPDMVPQLMTEGNALKLGGEKLWLTAMFTDIADFTTITEDMPAERTSEMLNAYFTEVMDVIFDNKGTLIKFIGDAVFAIWGAPVKVANHSEMGLRTALAIQKEVERFNATNRFPPLNTRIGVHTGPMLVGNLGSKKRFDYTAIGDSVNLASRIEGLNKYFGTVLLFTEATRRDAGGFVDAVTIATVRVKGRREPVKLFSLFEPALSSGILDLWSQSLGHFAASRFVEARVGFQEVYEKEERLRVACKLYLGDCSRYMETPPPSGWAGELDFDVK